MNPYLNNRYRKPLLLAFVVLIGITVLSQYVFAAYNASDLLGQLDNDKEPIFTIGEPNNTENGEGMTSDSDAVVDVAGHRLFVVDNGNNRVLVFNLNTDNTLIDRTADAVLGQQGFKTSDSDTTAATFNGPNAIAYDAAGNRLFVADNSNNRVLVFNVAAITDGEDAVNVLGQDDFVTSDSGTSQDTLTEPAGLAYDSIGNRLFVSDTGNNRVLAFDVAAITDGEPAINVLGQGDFDTADPGTTLAGLDNPVEVTYDGGSSHLFVADAGNDRILVFDVTAITDGEDAIRVLGQQSSWATSFDTPQIIIDTFTLDTGNSILYAGTSDNIYRCDTTTDCDVAGDWTVSSASLVIQALLFDPVNDVIYSGASNGLYRCDTATDCDEATDWTVSIIDGVPFYSLTLDTTNNVLYAGAGSNGDIYRCDTTTDCDVAGDWTIAYDSSESEIYSFTFDSANDVLYAGTQPSGIIFRCDTATDCDADGDWTTSVDTSAAEIRSLVFDSANEVLYAGSDGTGVIYRCDTTTDCNAGGDWTVSFDTGGTRVFGLAFDSLNNVLYAGRQPDGIIYRCDTTTDCNVAGDWTVSFNSPEQYIDSLFFDTINGVMYGGSAIGGIIYRCDTFGGCTGGVGVNAPQGVEHDADNDRLFVSDTGNNRVLAFDVVVVTNGESPVNVLGQTDFVSTNAATTQNGLDGPGGLAYDPTGEQLFTADTGNNRVMVFDVAVITDGEDAVDLLGQIDRVGGPIYTTGNADNAPNAQGLSEGIGVALDVDNHRLFISDRSNNRVLVFDLNADNTLIDRTADAVLGQPHFNVGVGDVTQGTFTDPSGLVYDPDNDRLFVSDTGNNRILVFNVAAITDGEDAVNVLGQDDFVTPDSDLAVDRLSAPHGLAYDVGSDRLFVADRTNARIMIFDVAAITDGEDAVNVLGQEDFDSNVTETSQDGMDNPVSVAFDPVHQRLFVGEGNNTRVTVFDVTAITNGEDAVNVLGQPNFVTAAQNTTQDGMSSPEGLVYDSDNATLWVADTENNRVMTFDVTAITDGEDAVGVVGQDDFVSGGNTVTQTGLTSPTGLTLDPSTGRLFIADRGNNRVIIDNFVRITTTSLPNATVGEPYDEDIARVNDQGTVSFELASGTLPPGLSVSSITGTPTTPGIYTFTLRVVDDNGTWGEFTDLQEYTMTVQAAAAPGGGGGGGGFIPTPTPVPSPTSTPPTFPTPGAPPGASPGPFPGMTPPVFVPPVISPSPGTSPTTSPSVPLPMPPIFGPLTPLIPVGILRAIVQAIRWLAPIVVVVTAIPLVAALTTAVAAGNAAAFSLFTVQSLLEVVGLKRRPRIWGTIYDGRTKHPIAYAKVELRDQNGRVLESRYADRDGRYGFLTSPSSIHATTMQVSMAPSAQGYSFPSKLVTTDPDFLVYEHVYHGGLVTVTGDKLVNFNIPMDPSQLPLAARKAVRPWGALRRFSARFLDLAFWVGLVVVPLNAVLTPSLFTIGLCVVFFGVNAARISAKLQRPYGIVRDERTRMPLAYALVTLNDMSGRRVTFAVSDERGRYFILSPPGSYMMTVNTPAQVQPMRSRSIALTTKKGWITRGLAI